MDGFYFDSLYIVIRNIFIVTDTYIFTDEKETILGRTKEGAVRGSLLKSTDGDLIYSFRGVPYGKPPVGSLRQALKQTLLSLSI